MVSYAVSVWLLFTDMVRDTIPVWR